MNKANACITRLARNFVTSHVSLNSAPKSSCKAGTVLNLKIKKSGDEPIALEDSEYPDWLWDCLDKLKVDAKLKETDFMKWRRKHLTKANTKKINYNNFISKM
ncbi:uncharacterized protein PRCAT00003428001 [Priceomyces carsonii]|uniref:uncharacterized protein n=1 Tax=Priceomyces carsonii TaxID=28549 RepID=UPI002EDAB1FD|nr:unnamed protein product [Priceomyces carsonii]